MLGERVRAARSNAAMSQQALAEAMNGYGFNWRQTTVAKVEAADRPTLFTEVVALGRIFRRDLDYFHSPRDALHDLADHLRKANDSLQSEEAAAKRTLKNVAYHLGMAATEEALTLAILDYRTGFDSGKLRDHLDATTQNEFFGLHKFPGPFEAAGILATEVQKIDRMALDELVAIKRLQVKGGGIRASAGPSMDEEFDEAAAPTAGNSKRPNEWIEYLRNDKLYKSMVAQMLVDLIVEHSSKIQEGGALR